MMRCVIAVLALAGLAACSTNPSPIHMVGERAAIDALAGEWQGTYAANPVTTGRAGSILFRLTAGQDTAYGDVLMIAPGTPGQDLVLRAPDPWSVTAARTTQVLSIRFVRSEGSTITGVLEEYVDPDCGCRLQTRFVGELRGDVVAGTFTTLHVERGTITGGRWSVERRPR